MGLRASGREKPPRTPLVLAGGKFKPTYRKSNFNVYAQGIHVSLKIPETGAKRSLVVILDKGERGGRVWDSPGDWQLAGDSETDTLNPVC